MPPKKRGGNNNTRHRAKKQEMIRADEKICQMYARITDLRGNRQFTVETLAGDKKTASIRGSLQRTRMRLTDLVLIEPLSDDLNGKWQIMFRYTQDQKSILEKEGVLKIVDQEEETNEEPEAFVFESEIKNENDHLQVDTSFIDDI